MFRRINRALQRTAAHAHDRGASAVEYGLLVAAIAAVIVGVIFGLGSVVKTAFSNTKSQIEVCSPDPAAAACQPNQ